MRHSKAPLVLMEQMIMLLVFALAAALCLQAFVKSDAASHRSEARDRAVTAAQTAAETLRRYGREGDMGYALTQAAEALGGDYQQGLLWLDYDADWNPIDYDKCGMEAPEAAYRLEAQGVPVETPGLWKARVLVRTSTADGAPDVLFEINTAWQEVDGNA